MTDGRQTVGGGDADAIAEAAVVKAAGVELEPSERAVSSPGIADHDSVTGSEGEGGESEQSSASIQ